MASDERGGGKAYGETESSNLAPLHSTHLVKLYIQHDHKLVCRFRVAQWTVQSIGEVSPRGGLKLGQYPCLASIRTMHIGKSDRIVWKLGVQGKCMDLLMQDSSSRLNPRASFSV